MPAKGIGYNPTKNKKPKAKKVLKDEKGTFKWERTGTRHGKKKVYLTNFSDVKAKAKKDMTSNKAYPLPFGETFRQAKAKGDKTFRWKNKSYHTKTKDELEAGAREKEKFTRKGKSNVEAAKSKKTLREKFTGYSTQAGYDEAKSERIKAKRIAKMEARKAAGKSYSKKNLAALKAS